MMRRDWAEFIAAMFGPPFVALFILGTFIPKLPSLYWALGVLIWWSVNVGFVVKGYFISGKEP
jgi:hypothetical protein